MSVMLRHSGDLPPAGSWDVWASAGRSSERLDADRELPDLAHRLEEAFDAVADDWLAFAREIGGEATAELSHLPSCAANVSDFGEMLAWTRIVADLADTMPQRTLVICDDPWLFRHIAENCGVEPGRLPGFRIRRIALAARGLASRLKYAIRAAVDAISLQAHRSMGGADGAWLLVYGHPSSDATRRDGYFGDLPGLIPSLMRILHVDCGRARATDLAKAGRVASLRAWGSPFAALSLPFVRWRPGGAALQGQYRWLVRRAAALEGGTAQPAAIRWQVLCQRAWLQAIRPAVVSWPWESHSWERVLVRDSRHAGIRTLGYQHSVIGRQMLNYIPQPPDGGTDILPDLILCTGQSTLDQLAAWGTPGDRLAIGGALRFPTQSRIEYDPAAPVFAALPFDRDIAAEIMEAIGGCSETGRQFTVRDHPMNPFPVRPSKTVRSAAGPLGEQTGASAVIYAATTVGLEALIMGLPTLRFRSRIRLAIDILPPGLDAPAADLHSLPRALLEMQPPASVERDPIFAAPDMDIWRDRLNAA